jgi:hypothetical protein
VLVLVTRCAAHCVRAALVHPHRDLRCVSAHLVACADVYAHVRRHSDLLVVCCEKHFGWCRQADAEDDLTMLAYAHSDVRMHVIVL